MRNLNQKQVRFSCRRIRRTCDHGLTLARKETRRTSGATHAAMRQPFPVRPDSFEMRELQCRLLPYYIDIEGATCQNHPFILERIKPKAAKPESKATCQHFISSHISAAPEDWPATALQSSGSLQSSFPSAEQCGKLQVSRRCW